MSPESPKHKSFLRQSTCSVQAINKMYSKRRVRAYPNPGVFIINGHKSEFSPRRNQRKSLCHQGLRLLKHIHTHFIYSASVHTKRRSPFITNIRLCVKSAYGDQDTSWLTEESSLFPPRATDLSLLQSAQTCSVTHPAPEVLTLGTKRPKCEANHSPHLTPGLRISEAIPSLQNVPPWHSQGQINFMCRVSLPASMMIQTLAALKHSDKLPYGTRDRETAYAKEVQYGRRSINTPRQCTHTDKTQSDKISQKLRRKQMIRISNAKAIKLVKSSLLRPRRQYICTPNLDTA
jgi:hypothetical protein